MTTPPRGITEKKEELVRYIFKIQSITERITDLQIAKEIYQKRNTTNVHDGVIDSHLRQVQWIEEEMTRLEEQMEKIIIK